MMLRPCCSRSDLATLVELTKWKGWSRGALTTLLPWLAGQHREEVSGWPQLKHRLLVCRVDAQTSLKELCIADVTAKDHHNYPRRPITGTPAQAVINQIGGGAAPKANPTSETITSATARSTVTSCGLYDRSTSLFVITIAATKTVRARSVSGEISASSGRA